MKGFSLVELMVVITITGVLTAVAVPAYQDYVVRAKVSNMLTMAEATKLAVAESIIAGTTPEYDKIANQDAVKEISVKDNVITITGDHKKIGLKKEINLTLTPNTDNPGMILWKCKVNAEDLKKYVPPECRNT